MGYYLVSYEDYLCMVLGPRKLQEKNFKLLENEFYNLLAKLQIYEDKTATISLSEQLRETVQKWLGSGKYRNLEGLIKEDRIKQLKSIIKNYPEISNEYEAIIDAFKFKKPSTSIELYNKPIQRVLEIMKELERFFFVAHIHIRKNSEDLIFISRCANTPMFAKESARRFKGFFDGYADISGLLTGYSSEEITNYCAKKRLRKYHLIK